MVKPIVYISACIEHDMCRYDGQFIASKIVKVMKDFVEFKTVCPEMAIGLGSPRESIRLVKQQNGDIRLMGYLSGNDVTDDMNHFTDNFVKRVKEEVVDGFILKSKSPSCGLSRVKLFNGIGKAMPLSHHEEGMFGGPIKHSFSNLPVEHEMRLTNDDLREHFFTGIFTRARFRTVTNHRQLVRFHTDNKYLLMMYSQAQLKKLGGIVANHDHLPFSVVQELYYTELITALSVKPSRKRNINSLQHIYGYFKNDLNSKEKTFFMTTLHKYGERLASLSTVLHLLQSYVIRFEQDYLSTQTIFDLYPIELMEIEL